MKRTCLYIAIAIYVTIFLSIFRSHCMDKQPDFKLVRSPTLVDLQTARQDMVVPTPIRLPPVRRYYYRPNTPYNHPHHQAIVVPMSPTYVQEQDRHVRFSNRNIVIDIDLIERHRQTTNELEEMRQELAVKHRRLKIAVVSTITSLAGLASALITYFSTKC